jgi:hypothetical protein
LKWATTYIEMHIDDVVLKIENAAR